MCSMILPLCTWIWLQLASFALHQSRICIYRTTGPRYLPSLLFSMDLESTHVIFMLLRTRIPMVVLYPLATFCGRTGTPRSSRCVTTWILVGNLLGDLGLHCFFCVCFCLGSKSAIGSLTSLLLLYPKSVSVSESSWASFYCVDYPEPTCDSDNDVPIQK
jgi:hypothetical protein